MKFTLKLVIDEKLTKTLDRLKEAPKQFGQALYAEAQPLMSAAVERTPRDAGGLVESAYVTRPSSGDSPALEVGFGAPYAAYVHERMDLPHPHGGEAKFLQRTIDAEGPAFVERVAERVRKLVEEGVAPDATARFPTQAAATSHSRHSASASTMRRTKLRRR